MVVTEVTGEKEKAPVVGGATDWGKDVPHMTGEQRECVRQFGDYNFSFEIIIVVSPVMARASC